MKHPLIIAPIIFLMHCYAQNTHSPSQVDDGAFVTKPLHNSNDFFKATAIVNDNSRNMATSYIRVMRSFTFHFEKATDQSWYRYRKNFIVQFTTDGKKTSAVFNRRGKLLYSFSNCSEKDLSDESRTFISTSYNNYKIICVTEAYYRGEHRFVVLLEGEVSFVYLWWKNKEMQEPMECPKVK